MTGNRSQRHAVPASPWKNPRQGGENTIDQIQDLGIEETPPPRRGRLVSAISGAVPRGNTPAEAGKTRSEPLRDLREEKHPRRGGEDREEGPERLAPAETPPPRRGRLSIESGGLTASRNTPAEAGKTTRHLTECAHVRKHPRRGGEDSNIW